MDRAKLSSIDEELDSSEVAELCFLCRDVVNRKRLEGITDAKGLFLRLEEKGLLDNSFFLYELLQTIGRADLLRSLETDSRQPEETDANPTLSDYRVMLYRVYEGLTKENFEKMKFLLLKGKQIETCNTALDVFTEMEKTGLLSKTKLEELHTTVLQLDRQPALTIQRYREGVTEQQQPRPPHDSVDYQRVNPTRPPAQLADLSISESHFSHGGTSVFTDAEPNRESTTHPDHADYYALTHNPRGLCVVINNEEFLGIEMKNRKGTQSDAEALRTVFTRLGFRVVIHDNLTAEEMRSELKNLGSRNFMNEDALVVCVLSHGESERVFGSDEKPVYLRQLKQPFTSSGAPSLAGKPKLFFIQACQGSNYQKGAVPCLPTPKQEERDKESHLEEDAGPVRGETVPDDADFLLGMSTVPGCKSFRNTSTGSVYIQELCTQLTKSAESLGMDDIHSLLTRVNREVSKRVYLVHKQMPELKSSLTKTLVLKFV